MAVDIEHVYQAIANFNCADTTASSRSAKWLNEFQRSVFFSTKTFIISDFRFGCSLTRG